MPAVSILLPNQVVVQQQQQQRRRPVIPELLLRPFIMPMMPVVPLLSAQREHPSSQCMYSGDNGGGDDEHGEDAAPRPADEYQYDQLQPA